VAIASFSPVAELLASKVRDHLRDHEPALPQQAVEVTVDTNSHLAEQRGAFLLRLLRQQGAPDIAQLSVVDVGCGFGALSLFFASLGARVTGIDVNANRLVVGREVARDQGLPVVFAAESMQSMDSVETAACDLVVVNNSYCYVIPDADRRATLSEVHRVLRRGGWTVLRNPNLWHPLDPFTRLPLVHLLPPRKAKRASQLMGRPRSMSRLTSPYGARRELRCAGFRHAHWVPTSHGYPNALERFARYHHVVARRG